MVQTKSAFKPPSLAQALKDPLLRRADRALVDHYAITIGSEKDKERKENLRAELRAKRRQQYKDYCRLLNARWLNVHNHSNSQIATELNTTNGIISDWLSSRHLPASLSTRAVDKLQDVPGLYFLAGAFTGNGFIHRDDHLFFGVDDRTQDSINERVIQLLEKQGKKYSRGRVHRLEVYSVPLVLALTRMTNAKTKIPRQVFEDRERAHEFLKGLFHACGGFVGRKDAMVRLDCPFAKNRPYIAEQIAVVLYRHFGILPTLSFPKRGLPALYIAHAQDMEQVNQLQLLNPKHQDRLIGQPVRTDKARNLGIEVSTYERALNLMRLPHARSWKEIADATGVNESTVSGWQSSVPNRAQAYARVINLAVKHGIRMPLEYPLAYERAFIHLHNKGKIEATHYRRR